MNIALPSVDQSIAGAVERCVAELAGMHEDLCPRQVLGLRMGLYAGDLLEVAVPRRDRRLLAFVEADGCFSDGVAVATGCWVGHRTLRVVDYGKVAVAVVDTQTGRGVRLAPRRDVRQRAVALVPGAPDAWHAMRDGYRAMAAGDLLDAEWVQLTVALDAILSRPGVRTTCDACGEEVLNEREVATASGRLCRGCAGERYYRADGAHACVRLPCRPDRGDEP